MSNRKVKRKRDKAVTIRMNKEEYSILQDKVKDSGLTQQAFVIGATKEQLLLHQMILFSQRNAERKSYV